MKIGIFGGSFNPPHFGHLAVAEGAMYAFDLNEIIFVPAVNPYMKDRSDMATYEERVYMVSLAVANSPFNYSTVEKDDTYSYTCNMLSKIKECHPDDELFLIIGSDSLEEMGKWMNPEKIFRQATVLVAGRGEVDTAKWINYYKTNYKANIQLIPTNPMNISSSEIRNNIKNGRPWKYLVPYEVYKYIEAEKLYMKEAEINV